MWSWRYENGEGQPVDGPGETFTSQADAESWVGQAWRGLAKDGVASVTLLVDDKVQYRMSLLAAGE